jgi:hypothetical protein
MREALLAVLAIAACHRSAPEPATLEGYLGTLAGADEAARARAVASWKLDRAAWERLTTDPYRAAYADYARAFDAAAPALVAQLAHGGTIAARPHFAGDPRLTRGQARARWAQPVQAPSQIADLDGAPIDAVFVRDGEHWAAIVGVDTIILDSVRALDPRCATLLETVVAGPCGDAAWVVAEGALRVDRSRFDHACALAASACRR